MQCPEQKVCTESSRQTFRSTGLWFKWKKQNKTLFPVHKIENVKESCSFGLHSGRVKHLHWERDVLWRQALKLLFQNQIIHLVIWGKKVCSRAECWMILMHFHSKKLFTLLSLRADSETTEQCWSSMMHPLGTCDILYSLQSSIKIYIHIYNTSHFNYVMRGLPKTQTSQTIHK